MKINRPLINLLFVFLPLLLLASPSYASMGDISICFPFFLLLALLMAGMIVQGRSPLVGFDISISRPPAQIKSTSYQFKSFTSGSFDTIAKMRDEAGGGNYATRGVGWVANKLGKGAATAVSKASGGKYGSKTAKEGVGWAKTMADRGALYAITSHSKKMQTLAKGAGKVASKVPIPNLKWAGIGKGTGKILPFKVGVSHVAKGVAETGIAGGGYQGTLEREQRKKEQEVKSLRDMYGYLTAGAVKLTLATSRIKELEKNRDKSKGAKKAAATRELNELREAIGAQSIIAGKRKQVDRLTEESKKRALTGEEAGRLKSLRKDLTALEAKFAKSRVSKQQIANIHKQLHATQKEADAIKVVVKQAEVARKELADIGGVQGRAKLITYTPVAAAGLTYLGAKHGAASTVKSGQKLALRLRNTLSKLGVKDFKTPLTEQERNRLTELRAKPQKDLKVDEKKELKILTLRQQYVRLSQRGMLGRVFNPLGLGKKEVAKNIFKGFVLAPTTGFLSSAAQNVPYHILEVRYERWKHKPHLKARLMTATDRLSMMNTFLTKLRNKDLTGAQKAKILKEIRKHENELKSELGADFGVLKGPMILSENQKKVKELNSEIQERSKELQKLYKKGVTGKELENRLAEFNKMVDARNKLLGIEKDEKGRIKLADTAILTRMKEIDGKTHNLNTKLKSGKLSETQKYAAEAQLKALEYERDGLKKQLKENVGIVPTLQLVTSREERERAQWDRIKEIDTEKKGLKENIKEIDDEIKRLDTETTRKSGKLTDDQKLEVKSTIEALNYKRENREKQIKQLNAELKTLPSYKRLKYKYEKATSFYPTETDKMLAARGGWAATGRLLDLWDEKLKGTEGRYNPESLAIRGVAFAARGFQETQKLRHVASTWENTIAPMLTKLAGEKFKEERLLRLLGKEQEEVQYKRKKLRGLFTQENLYSRRNRLIEETRELKQSRPNSTELKRKREELQNTNALIADARIELAKTKKNINKILDAFLVQDALLAYRQKKDFTDKEDELHTEVNSRIVKLDKELKKYHTEKSQFEKRIGAVKVKEEREKLSSRLDAVNASIKERETEKKSLTDRLAMRSEELDRVLQEAAKKTEIRVGGERVLRDRDLIRSELSLSQTNSLQRPNEYAIGLVTKYVTEDRDKLRKDFQEHKDVYTKEDEHGKKRSMTYDEKMKKYYDEHREDYKQDLRRAYMELKKKWNRLETINVGDWTHNRMQEIGEATKGIETGLNRDRVELDLITRDRFKKEFLKVDDAKAEAINKEAEETAKDWNKTIGNLDKSINKVKEKRAEALDKADNVEAAKLALTIEALEKKKSNAIRDRNEDVARLDQIKEKTGLTLQEHIKRKEKYTESRLYIANLEYAGVIPTGEAQKYEKLVQEIEKLRSNTARTAKLDAQEIDLRIKVIKDTELKEAEEIGWTKRVNIINERIAELEAKKKELENVRETPQDAESIRKLRKTEDKLTRFAFMHEAAELLQRENYVNESRSGVMRGDTRQKLDWLKATHPKEKNKANREFWNEAERLSKEVDRAESKSILTKYENNTVQLRNEIKEISSKVHDAEMGYKELNRQYEKGKLGEKEKELKSQITEAKENLNKLYADRREKQKELNTLCKDWHDFREEYQAIYEPFGRSEKITGPGSEHNIKKALADYADEDIRNRFGIWRAMPERFAERASGAVEKITTFGAEHGGKILAAAVIAAPLAMPFLGIGAAAAITAGSIGIFGAKTLERKEGYWQQKGYPYSSDYDAILNVATAMQQWGSHLTGRGSGAPPKTVETIWNAYMSGNMYAVKGAAVDPYLKLIADKEALELPDYGLPWYIRLMKAPMESVGASTSFWAKRFAVRLNYPGGEDEFKRIIVENDRWIAETQKQIQYQMVQLYGSILPMPASKQAREMLGEREVRITMPFYDPARDIIILKDYAPDPIKLILGLGKREESYRLLDSTPANREFMKDMIERSSQQVFNRQMSAYERMRGRG
jgi:hypothetical protein